MEKAYPDVKKLRRELEKSHKDRYQATLDRDKAILDRDHATLDKYKAILEMDMLKAELKQTRKMQETMVSRDQLKSEFDGLQRRQPEVVRSKDRKARTPIEPLMARSRPESKMEVDEVPNASGRSNLDRVAQEQMSKNLETGTHSVLERSRIEPDETAEVGCGISWPDAQLDWW